MDSKLEALERRLQAVTTTLINAQTELSRVKEELASLQPGASSKTPTPARREISSVQQQEVPASQPATSAATMSTPPRVGPKRNVEEFIGGKLITLIGIFILVVGLGIFVKYAIDNDLIGPIGRVTLGMMAGVILLGTALKLKAKYAGFSAVLLSGGMCVLYFTTYASYDFYSLVPQWFAFILMVILTAFTVFSAIMYNMEIIAILGLVGAYGVPFLLSDNSGRVLILFSYMAIVNIGILVLAFQKYWRVMNWVAFGMTWLIVASWFGARYDAALHQNLTLGFSLLFFLMFYVATTFYKLSTKEAFGPHDVILICLNSIAYYAIGYSVFDRIDAGTYLGLFSLFNAAVHSGFAFHTSRSGLTDRRFFLLEIALMLAFVIITIPVQLDGNWVTLAWAAGACLLLWIGLSQSVVLYERIAYTLVLLSCASLLDDWSLYSSEEFVLSHAVVFNVLFLTSVLVIASWSFMLWLAFSKLVPPANLLGRVFSWAKYGLLVLFLIVIYFTGHNEVSLYWNAEYYRTSITTDYRQFNSDVFVFREIWLSNYTMLYLVGLAVCVLMRWTHRTAVWVVTAFGLIAILSFLVSILPSLSYLHRTFLEPPLDRQYPVHNGYLYLRYFCYPWPLILLWFLQRLFKMSVMPFRSVLTIVFHVVLVVILSFELLSIMIQLNPSEIGYYDDLTTRLGFSILWGIYSLILIAFGILKRKKPLRLLGIGLFGVTLAKLYVFDLGEISTGSKIVLFLALGVLLLVIAFLYQKFKDIIFAKDENP